MNIINNSLPLPHLISDMIDFKHVEVDESCGDMMLSFDLFVNDDCGFDGLFELLHNQIRHNHYPLLHYEVEPEFEDSLNNSLRLVITMNDYGNYEFNLFNFAGEDYTSIQVDLSNDEIELFKPYMLKYFESDDQIEDVRKDVCRSVNVSVSKKDFNIIKTLHLISDRIIGKAYLGAWMSEDKNRCLICTVDDFTDNACPAMVAKFGF